MKRSLNLIPLLALPLLAQPPVPREEATVKRQASEILSSDYEAWRRIPWAPSLSAAAALAKKEGRPVFVFSHEGNIDTGRC
jgi:hypothetical protein